MHRSPYQGISVEFAQHRCRPGLPHFGSPTIAEFGWAIVVGLAAALLGAGIRWLGLRLQPFSLRSPPAAALVAGLVVAGLAIAYAEGTGKNDSGCFFINLKKSVEQRKHFIQTNAKDVRFLDGPKTSVADGDTLAIIPAGASHSRGAGLPSRGSRVWCRANGGWWSPAPRSCAIALIVVSELEIRKAATPAPPAKRGWGLFNGKARCVS